MLVNAKAFVHGVVDLVCGDVVFRWSCFYLWSRHAGLLSSSCCFIHLRVSWKAGAIYEFMMYSATSHNPNQTSHIQYLLVFHCLVLIALLSADENPRSSQNKTKFHDLIID